MRNVTRCKQHEDKFAVKQFVKLERRADESLQSWVDRYKSLYRRAAASGYTPASDAAAVLMRRSSINAQAHGQFIGEFRSKETQLGRKMTPSERHVETYAYLCRVVASMEQLKFDRDYAEKATADKADKVNAAAGGDGDAPRKRRNRNRKPAKRTTTVPPRDDAMTGAAKPVSPKRGAVDAQPKKKAKHDADSAAADGPASGAAALSAQPDVLTAMTAAMSAIAGMMKGKGKGKGKGTGFGFTPKGGEGCLERWKRRLACPSIRWRRR